VTSRHEDTELARSLEEDAERFPDQLGELLTEAGELWLRAGEHARAIELFEQVVAIGGEDGEFARVSLAESLFELGGDADALAQLDALKELPPSSPEPCLMAGELLEARARTELALVWFDLAVSLLTVEERSAMRSAGASGMYGKMIVAGRRRVRRKLGLPNDELDEAVPPPWFPGDEGFVSTDELLELPGRIPARQLRSLFWQVREFGEAVRRWPAIFSANGPDHRAYHARLESRWRQLAERGVARITLVPASAEGLSQFAERTGGDPGDEHTRKAYMDETATTGIDWPPARNAACWCGRDASTRSAAGILPQGQQLHDPGVHQGRAGCWRLGARCRGDWGYCTPLWAATRTSVGATLMSQELQAKPFAHLDAPNAELYRRVMGVFVAAKRRFLVHLRPEDLASSLDGAGGSPVDLAAVEAALRQLELWRNLRADPDTSRVTTVDDFYRPRYLYQLTPEGEAAEVALAAYDEALGNRGELQSVALEDIRVRLRGLCQQAEAPDRDPAVVHSLLRELSTLLDGLAGNASAFMSSLQRTIDLQDVDEDAFTLTRTA
jgi:tetratricopeptide (TPR) repeat protein